jgi:hypothetical protein
VSSAYEVSKEVVKVESARLVAKESIGIGIVFKAKAIAEVLEKMAASVAMEPRS